MKTLTIKKGGGGDYVSFAHGWHKVVVSKAAYGDWNGKKFLDIFFEGLPESFNLRTYEKINQKTNEEFSIMQVFRFANAGISDSLDSQTGETVLKIDDSPGELVGKELNIFINDYHRDQDWQNKIPHIYDENYKREGFEKVKDGTLKNCWLTTAVSSPISIGSSI